MSISDPFTIVTVGAAALAAIILIWFLGRRPVLGGVTKVALLFGFGVFPILASTSANVGGYHVSKQRSFCGSCHVMKPWTEDAGDPDSLSLASRHGRNRSFGAENCYACHADYGMFGTVTTKLGGLRHVYEYVWGGYGALTEQEALAAIHIVKPFPNDTCMQCHSTTTSGWLAKPDHVGLDAELRTGAVSCASEGCHGPAHPFSKVGKAAHP